ncbi:hypothetical protein LJR045_000982 [Microbacterium sp. LjRoot45]|uniref:hypothetical protein n=1 Tax=Microbacterium sp. LjRoot45 TaxID=3342329 RepID=UPI003ECD5799
MIPTTAISTDEDLARRVLVRARSIAPCIDNFIANTEPYKDAVAILKGVIAELPDPGARRAKSLSRDGTSITFADIESAFDADAITSLRSLCTQAAAPGTPLGSFPERSAIANLWPEGRYT